MDTKIHTKYQYKTHTNRRVHARALDRDDGPRSTRQSVTKGEETEIDCNQSWRRRERWMRCLPTFPRDAPGWYTRSRVVRNFVMDIHACARATDGVDPSIHSLVRFATDD
jgi:hypothetical protein